MTGTYDILGIHGADVVTVDGDVARVRFFPAKGKKKGKLVDENIPLPALPPGMPASTEGYLVLMKDTLDARLKKLEAS